MVDAAEFVHGDGVAEIRELWPLSMWSSQLSSPVLQLAYSWLDRVHEQPELAKADGLEVPDSLTPDLWPNSRTVSRKDKQIRYVSLETLEVTDSTILSASTFW